MCRQSCTMIMQCSRNLTYRTSPFTLQFETLRPTVCSTVPSQPLLHPPRHVGKLRQPPTGLHCTLHSVVFVVVEYFIVHNTKMVWIVRALYHGSHDPARRGRTCRCPMPGLCRSFLLVAHVDLDDNGSHSFTS